MGLTIGSGNFIYDHLDSWQKLPNGMRLIETPGLAVNSKDEVYALTRNTDHPVMVFDREGTYLRSFGKNVFSNRTHGAMFGPDDTLFCADDGTHTITKWTTDGELLMTIGTPDVPKPRFSGEPFNKPTHAAISPNTGDIFVTDGYGNARVHKFTSSGEYILSWGEPGIDPGQFLRPHNIVMDSNERIYVADREAHRVQVFDTEGGVIEVWNNLYMPDGMTIGPDGNIYIGELNGLPGMDDAPGLGHRISILDQHGNLLARFGDPYEGEEPGKFTAPHSVAVDSHGDIYVGEVSYTIRGSRMDPPRELRSLSKLVKIN
ncbi:peptidyl-alpha-hydroxyglycine alpha-amidating lyase family protein [Dehalococcoidia bacterium]|nr:peptidyl-alpha-hydroxyglycine alpha-amidating lyase family protein [Dehalococcoidia bacterium]